MCFESMVSLEEVIGEIERRSSKSGEYHRYYKQIESLTPLLIRPQQLLLHYPQLNEAVAVHPTPDQLLQGGQGLAICV